MSAVLFYVHRAEPDSRHSLPYKIARQAQKLSTDTQDLVEYRLLLQNVANHANDLHDKLFLTSIILFLIAFILAAMMILRSRSENELEEREQHFRGLVNGSSQGVWLHSELRFVYVNKSMASILGYDDPAELLKCESILEVFPEPLHERLWHLHNTRLSSDIVPHNFEAQLVRTDGERLNVNINIKVTSWQGKKTIQGMFSDVSDQKFAEQRLRVAKEEAEFANRAKTQFLANMSHELRTPLNAIIGFSDMMRRQPFGPLGSPKYLEYSEDISDSGNHLLEIISDVLDVSKIEAGMMELNRQPTQLAHIVDSCLKFVGAKASDAGIGLSIEIEDNLPDLYCDELRLRQILLNLLANAVKFTPKGGTVKITAMPAHRNLLILSVEDTGRGIAADDLDRILEPFEQIENVMTRNQEGTGLGLYLVKTLTEMHGGRMVLNSEIDVGTKIELYLPTISEDQFASHLVAVRH